MTDWTREDAKKHRETCFNGMKLRPHPTFDRLHCSACGLTIINKDLSTRKYGIVQWAIDDFMIKEWA